MTEYIECPEGGRIRAEVARDYAKRSEDVISLLQIKDDEDTLPCPNCGDRHVVESL